MNLSDYIKSCIFDFVIVLVLTSALAFDNLGAFFVNTSLQYNLVVLTVLSALFLVVFFAAAYTRRTAVIGVPVAIVVLIIACLVASATSQASSFFADEQSNAVPFVVVIFVVSLVVFVFTRKRTSLLLLVVIMALDVGFIEFMYEENYAAAVVVAFAAVLAMLVFRNYRSNLRTASTTVVSFGGAFGTGLAFAAVVIGVACAIFIGIIAPANPVAHEFKPFTRYLNFEQVDMTGVGDTTDLPNEDNTTQNLNDNTTDTTQENDDTGDQDTKQDESKGDFSPLIAPLRYLLGTGVTLLKQLYNFLLENPFAIPFFILVVLAVLSSPFVLKKRLRARRYNQMRALPPALCVKQMYHFFLKRLKLLKIVKTDTSTLNEFAERSRGATAPFANNPQGACFEDLTGIYSSVVYGNAQPNEGELASYDSFYAGFYQAFVKESGRFKYIFRFFRV